MMINKECFWLRNILLLAVSASIVYAESPRYAAIARRARVAHTNREELANRAPRTDLATTPAIVSPFDSALLADIAACCCNLTNIVLQCCSLTSGLIGSLGTPGICDASRWRTVAGIQGTEQPVIGWLKTIMIELRGLCQPMP